MKYSARQYAYGSIYTPIHEFAHPATASTVSIVGMVHEGLPSFYRSVNEYVKDREETGSLVHMESSNLPDKDVLATYPSWVRKLAPKLSEMLGGLDAVSNKNTALQSDPTAFTIEDSWEVHDLNTADIVEALGAVKSKIAVKLMERLVEVDAGQKSANELSYGLQLFGVMQIMRGVIINRRNDVAVAAFKEAIQKNPDQSITLIWGADHAPGLAKGVAANGYAHQNTEWLEAAHESRW